MTTVILDTAVLRQEGLRSARMLGLAKLATARRIRIVVPDIVAREFLGQWAADVTGNLAKTAKELSKLAQRLDPATDFQRTLAELAKQCEPLEKRAAAAIDADLARWIEATHAERIRFSPDAIHGVVDDYFAGAGAFRAAKVREDFPDALILATVRAEVAQGSQVYVVSADNRFREAAGKVGVVGVAETVLLLLQQPHFVQLSEDVQRGEASPRRPELFKEIVFLDKLANWLRGAKDAIEDIYVEKEQIAGLELLDLPLFGVSINYPDAASVGTVIIDLAVNGEGEHYDLSIQFDARCRVDFSTTFLDYLD